MFDVVCFFPCVVCVSPLCWWLLWFRSLIHMLRWTRKAFCKLLRIGIIYLGPTCILPQCALDLTITFLPSTTLVVLPVAISMKPEEIVKEIQKDSVLYMLQMCQDAPKRCWTNTVIKYVDSVQANLLNRLLARWPELNNARLAHSLALNQLQ